MILELREQISRLINGGGATNGQILAYNATTKRYEPATFVDTSLITSGAGTPIGSVVPASVGAEYFDTVAKIRYKSVGLTNADWEALLTGTP